MHVLASMARLDGDLCYSEAELLATHEQYSSANRIIDIAQLMVRNMHHKACKHFYDLLMFLLTLPVTSSSCERSHSKVDLIKSAVRSSMASKRLENLIIVSAEKKVFNTIPNASVVARFADKPRGLPL